MFEPLEGRHISQSVSETLFNRPNAQMPLLASYENFPESFLESRGTDQAYLIGLDSSLGFEMFDDF